MKNWDPEYYDQNSSMQYQIALTMLNALSLKGDESIIDIGSGNGKVSAALAKKVPQGRVVGIDISENMVRFARQHYQEKNLIFENCDVVSLNYENNFDVAVSFWTLSWIHQQQIALSNIIKSLKNHGKLLLMYPMRHDVYDLIDQIIEQPEWSRYFINFTSPRPFFSEEQYRKLLRDLNLQHLVIDKKQIECKFNSKEEMISSIYSWCSYLDRIPDESHKQLFIKHIVEQYLRIKKTKDYLMHFNVLEISGEKSI